ncbi:putative pectinesterase/pectinesterase inhibitor 41 [Cinnamomum micranthum f. kanehirae]|uniref:Pectinesterase n=1 Tax=Cinnamomum micranthum f. kanehirae TaxID=337451 RepID=A0A443PTX4_9MAGN|nr:putative pectinesterase/pectinesterase inhibitor 41 [Cinnamomum micranthum f. kanehirae]
MALKSYRLFFLSIVIAIANSIVIRELVVVDQHGLGNFTTIREALAAAPNGTDINGGFFQIHIKGGIYEEYVSVAYNKKNIMMTGDGKNITIISGNRSVGDGWKTSDAWSFDVNGEHFIAINMTFRNIAGAAKAQALAVQNNANLSAFYNCSFEGFQDTLCASTGLQFYRNCDIYGTIDFIFGYATAVFQNCNIYVRLPLQGQSCVIAAHGRRAANNNTGYSFQHCKISASPDLASRGGSTKTYLGRPWGPYSRTVYMQSIMDALVDPLGWLAWDEKTNYTSTLYYGEYNNTGLGSKLDQRVKWPGNHAHMSEDDAINFVVSNFISGDSWLPATGIPFQRNLL